MMKAPDVRPTASWISPCKLCCTCSCSNRLFNFQTRQPAKCPVEYLPRCGESENMIKRMPSERRVLSSRANVEAVPVLARKPSTLAKLRIVHLDDDVLPEIFCHLDLRTLAACQRVCKSWQLASSSLRLWNALLTRLHPKWASDAAFPISKEVLRCAHSPICAALGANTPLAKLHTTEYGAVQLPTVAKALQQHKLRLRPCADPKGITRYPCVLTWAHSTQANAMSLALRERLLAGGNLVTGFVNTKDAGDVLTRMLPIIPRGQCIMVPRANYRVTAPAHEIFTGLTENYFCVQRPFRAEKAVLNTTTPAAAVTDVQVLMEWWDGEPLLAMGRVGQAVVVSFNVWPPHVGGQLLARVCRYVAMFEVKQRLLAVQQ
eukprot:TRINITY_DN708_c0_g1_i1.p1 TRINITY_DN708_c0_g1~~TRINITY_DN708_c0_g1_i1.p1  ORF type:complete len:375 (-),score=50.87 TRINITY_DN708_c0_g1_i1:56-1180(-)